MTKKKIDLDTSFIWALKGLQYVGSDEGVDYYHVAINNHGAFVVEVNNNAMTVDLILTPIVDVGVDFVDTFKEARHNDDCIDLQHHISVIAEFLKTYKDSIVPYYGLLEMVRNDLDNE